MRPKFEWLLNAALIALFLIVGAGLVVLAQYSLGSAILGLLFYGGIATLLFSLWRQQKHEKPRRQNAKRGFGTQWVSRDQRSSR